MTRRTLLALCSGSLAQAQLPREVPYRDYPRVLPDYISSLAAQARNRRESAIGQLTTPAAIHQRKRWARETFWTLIGGRPDPTPLNIQKHGGFERTGYRLEKLTYESRPGLTVTANLYIPTTGKPPFPAVLFQMGHSPNGKAAALYQKCCQALARLGYVVLGFDPMGQGERLFYPPNVDPDTQHTRAGLELLAHGDTVTRLQAWDAIRSLDVLAGLPMVDPSRLASTGQSGGGTLTQMLACLDDRLAVAAVSCGNTENFACANFLAPGSTDDAEQDFIASGLAGFDRWDTLYPFAPKPLLVMASARDFFGTYSPSYLADGRPEFARLAACYRVLGKPDRIAWKETPLAHALTYGLRMEIYNWFEKWLKGSDRVIAEEPPVAPEPDSALLCGVKVDKPKLDWGGPLRINIEEKPRTAPARVLSRVPTEGAAIEALEVESDRGVFLPAWRWVPPQSSRTLLVFEGRGRAANASENGLYHQLAQAGITVCAADVRGIGDLTPEFSRGAVGHARSHANEDDWAWASLILGRPLLAQRIADILAWVGAMNGPVMLAATRQMTAPATYAAAADPRIARLLIADPRAALANLLPGGQQAAVAPHRLVTIGEPEWNLDTIRKFALS